MKKIFLSEMIAAIMLVLSFTNNAGAQEVVELRQPQASKSVIKFMFNNGSISDPAGKEGLTQFTTSMIADGGTETMTKSQIDDMLYPWAAYISASVDKEVSIFTFQCPSAYVDKFYPIMMAVMTDPAFSKEDFLRIQSNQQNYVDEVIRSSSDEEYSKKALEDLLFRGTRYQYMTAGTSSGVKSITTEDIKAHYKNYYSSSNVLIGLAGNYPSDLAERIKKDLQKLGNSIVAGQIIRAKPRQPKGLEIEIISKENALGSAICMGFPLDITRSSNSFASLMIANSWLGEHRKSYSHLYKKIREERSMNYGNYSYIEWYDNGGSNMLPRPGVPRSSNYFSIWIRPVQTAIGLKKQYPELADINIGHAHFAIRMALHEMQQLIENGMSEEDFNSTREFLRSYIKLYIQTTEKQLGYLMDSKFYGRKDYIKEMCELFESVTLDEVNETIKKFWQTQNFYVTVVTDASEAEPLKRSLESNAPSPMSYSDVLKGSMTESILKEDKLVENHPLNVRSVKIIKSADTFRLGNVDENGKPIQMEQVVPEMKMVK